jgi:F-type H+-transporting ATPase subunit b
MVDLNYTLLIQIINFLVLIFVLNLLLYKPILKIMGRRQETISASEEEVKNLNETIEARMAEYEAKIRDAKVSAMGQRNEILQQGTAVGKEMMDGAKKEIAGMMDDFQQKLNAEMEKAKSILHNQSKLISKEIAEKVLGRSI